MGGHRGPERGHRPGHHVGHAGGSLVLHQGLVPEPVAQAGGVGDEVVDGRPGARLDQDRLVAVEALQHLHVGEVGEVVLHGGVEVELTTLLLLQGGRRRDHLGHGHDAEVRGGADRVVGLAGDPDAGATLVDGAVAVGDDGRHVGYGAALHRLAQDRVDPAPVDLCRHLCSSGLLRRSVRRVPTVVVASPARNRQGVRVEDVTTATWRWRRPGPAGVLTSTRGAS